MNDLTLVFWDFGEPRSLPIYGSHFVFFYPFSLFSINYLDTLDFTIVLIHADHVDVLYLLFRIYVPTSPVSFN